jgi:SLT domain-containing protein
MTAPSSQASSALSPGLQPDKAGVDIAAQSDTALAQAMALERVPASWQSGLRFIMAQESGGHVDAKSPIHSARGLYQLTAANYHFNPHGAASFGNAVEEAQGGIRYIKQRYGTADNAATFWQSHHWY